MTDGAEQVRSAFEKAETVSPDHEGGSPPIDPPPRTPDESPPIEADGAKFPLNDTGNGKRFSLYYGGDCMPVPRVSWFVWDQRRWAKDPDEIKVRGFAHKVQDRIVQEIQFLELEKWQQRELDQEVPVRNRYDELTSVEPDQRSTEERIEVEELTAKLAWIKKIKDRRSSMKSDHRSFAKTTGNKGRLDAMLTEAKVQLSKDVDQLDADELAVNTESGTLWFSTIQDAEGGLSKTAHVELRPHDRGDLITKMMPLKYDPDALCPQFDQFLERVQPDPEMRAFLQRWFGVSMTGLMVQKFAFLYGSGANGKSVIVDLMAKMMGDYAATAKIESLTGRNRRGGGDATPDLVPLVGARMARASEPEEGERLQEGTIKELTGGEPIMVRSLHADFIEVQPIFKLTISGNHKPDIRGTDDGIWRRVLLVPFDVQIPEKERDAKLGEKLWTERDGIFNWLVAGLIDYLEGGLQVPKFVSDATLDYREDSDPIGAFLRENCVVTGDPEDFITARDLMDGFNLWLDLKGDTKWGARTASLKFKSLAGRYQDPNTKKKYESGKRKVTGYRCIGFTDEFRSLFDEAPRDSKGHPVAGSSAGGTGLTGPTGSSVEYPI